MSQAAEEVLDALNKGLYQKATRLWEKTEMVIQQVRGDAFGPAYLAFPLGGEGTLVGVVRAGVYPETAHKSGNDVKLNNTSDQSEQ